MDPSFLKYPSYDSMKKEALRLADEIRQKQEKLGKVDRARNWSLSVCRYDGMGKPWSVPFCVYAIFSSTPNKAYSPAQLKEELRRYHCCPHSRSIQKAIVQLRKAGLVERIGRGLYAYKEPTMEMIVQRSLPDGKYHSP